MTYPRDESQASGRQAPARTRVLRCATCGDPESVAAHYEPQWPRPFVCRACELSLCIVDGTSERVAIPNPRKVYELLDGSVDCLLCGDPVEANSDDCPRFTCDTCHRRELECLAERFARRWKPRLRLRPALAANAAKHGSWKVAKEQALVVGILETLADGRTSRRVRIDRKYLPDWRSGTPALVTLRELDEEIRAVRLWRCAIRAGERWLADQVEIDNDTGGPLPRTVDARVARHELVGDGTQASDIEEAIFHRQLLARARKLATRRQWRSIEKLARRETLSPADRNALHHLRRKLREVGLQAAYLAS